MKNIKIFWDYNFKPLFQKKSIYDLNLKSLQNNRLKKSLSLFQIVMFGVGVIIGSGIFVLTGIGASRHAGPAITLSFALTGIICSCAGLCYAEFSSMLYTSGSSYSYIYITFGRFPAWIVGSFSIIGYFLGAASVAAGWSRYFSDALKNLDLTMPLKFSLTTNIEYKVNDNTCYAIFDIPAFAISFISTLILYKGITLSSIITTFSVIIKLFVLFCFIVIGIFYVDLNNWTPYIPENTGNFGDYGVSGIISGVSMIFLAFNGFDSICTSSQEVKNSKINIPLGIIITITIVTTVYILTSAVMTGLVSYQELQAPQALSFAVDKIGLQWLSRIVKFGAVIGLSSVVLVSQYTVIRMILIMSEDGLLPKVLTRVHVKNRIPHIATLAVGTFMSIISATINLNNIIKLSSLFILLTLISICTASIFMKYTFSSLKRVFLCPCTPFTPLIAITIALYIVTSYPVQIYFYSFICLVTLTLFYYLNNKLKVT